MTAVAPKLKHVGAKGRVVWWKQMRKKVAGRDLRESLKWEKPEAKK